MRNILENLSKQIGSIVVSLGIVAIPILCGLSFGFNWDNIFKIMLTFCSICEASIIWILLGGGGE